MNALYLLVCALGLFILAYRFYGRFLSGVFGVDPAKPTPAHSKRDNVDFVPAKNWWVLFGHHFSSICGAGPIVGPVLAVVYWGWGVSIVWIILGVIWMGAVSDFSSLIMSVKSGGQSIANIAGDVISKRARLLFSIFLWISLILVIAVFLVFAAKTLIQEPDAVVPSFGLIPTAILVGWLLYRKKMANGPVTLMGLVILALLLVLGRLFPLSFDEGRDAQTLWILILLGYCFFASILPVQVLLQPRDYIASFVLFAMIGIGVLSVIVVRPTLQLPVFTAFWPADWPKAGPLWPMLFVTIACGAISGFHAIVSSGTTCKQIGSEAHACRIGYGGMLTEALVGVLVLIAVAAGLSTLDARGLLVSGGPIAVFGAGYGNLSDIFLGSYGKAFAILALNAFILTTLDTATRITRYITAELFGIKNIYAATLLVVIASAGLVFTGHWQLLWPAFGAANQLIAGITLLLASCWLLARGKNFQFTLIPSLIMLVTTVGALGFQIFRAVTRRGPEENLSPDWGIGLIAAVLITIAGMLFWDAFRLLRTRAVRPA